MQILKFKLTGLVPMLMHNGQTANPLNEFSRKIKEISSKRKKTDQDFEDMAKLEFSAGLYLAPNGDGELRPCIPGIVLEATICGRGGAARKEKAGKQAQASIFCDRDFLLEYDGPKDPEEMWGDPNMRDVTAVRVQSNKIMRTRPKIPAGWTAECEITYNENLVNREDLIRWLEVAGEEVGLMDWRPKYGRFEVEIYEAG